VKIRTDFVTNSSSTSFVIGLKNIKHDELKEKIKGIILQKCISVSVDEINQMYNDGDIDDIYYLIDYSENDENMHVWVKRDECMDDEELDNILWDWDQNDISPKWDRHY